MSKEWVPLSHGEAEIVVFKTISALGGNVPREISDNLMKILTTPPSSPEKNDDPIPKELTILHGGRRTGKTTRMLKWLGDHPDAVFVTFHEREAERIRDICRQENKYSLVRRIVTLRADTRYLGQATHVGIDNLDMVLQNFFHLPVTYATTTLPVVVEEMSYPE